LILIISLLCIITSLIIFGFYYKYIPFFNHKISQEILKFRNPESEEEKSKTNENNGIDFYTILNMDAVNYPQIAVIK